MGTELVAFEAMDKMAQVVAKSKLWKTVDSPEKAMALMLLCQSEGLHPMAAVRRYDLIQGVPTLKSEAQLAEFYSRGGMVKWIERSATACKARFSHAKHCPDGVEIAWTLEDARKAGLTGKDNWVKFPRQMLSARVAAEGVQVVDPGAGLGMLTQEEMMDVQNNLADTASQFSAALTGVAAEPLTALPQVTETDEKGYRKIRAEMNKAMQDCKTVEAFRKVSLDFQQAHSKAIWVTKTGHNAEETFADLATRHQERIQRDLDLEGPAGETLWIMGLKGSVGQKGLADFVKSYREDSRFQTQAIENALTERAWELGLTAFTDVEPPDDDDPAMDALKAGVGPVEGQA